MPLPWLIAGGIAAAAAIAMSDKEEKKAIEEAEGSLFEAYAELKQYLENCISACIKLEDEWMLNISPDELDTTQLEYICGNSNEITEEIQNLLEAWESNEEIYLKLSEQVTSLDDAAIKAKCELKKDWDNSLSELEQDFSFLADTLSDYVDNLNLFIEETEARLLQESDILYRQLEKITSIELKYLLRDLNQFIKNMEIDESVWYEEIISKKLEQKIRSYMNQVNDFSDEVFLLKKKMDDIYERAIEQNIDLEDFKESWDAMEDVFLDESQNLMLKIGEFRGKCDSLVETTPIYKNSEKVSIAVVAPMSSGKSTLINAILGYELLPSKNEACTATVITILDDDNTDTFTAELLDETGGVLQRIEDITERDLEIFNERDVITQIRIRGNIESIHTNERAIELIDTPGPNNSRNGAHKCLTVDTLQNYPFHFVLYVLNATQLGINDDYIFLQEVIQAVEKEERGDKEERIIFVLNKCDELDVDDGESISAIIASVKGYLLEHGFINPRIIPVSALAAKLIRQKQRGDQLTKKELREYEMCLQDGLLQPLERYAQIPHGLKMLLNRYLELAERYQDRETIALMHTGILSLEVLLESML